MVGVFAFDGQSGFQLGDLSCMLGPFYPWGLILALFLERVRANDLFVESEPSDRHFF